MYEIIAFYIFSALTLGCVSVSVFSKNILLALSTLVAGMIFISALFFLLGAEFLGVVQIIVYTGAVMVLYAFSMMFFNVSSKLKEKKEYSIYLIAIFISILLTAIFIAPTLTKTGITSAGEFSNIKMIGIFLFSKYLLAFELTAVLLLIAMVAGIVLISKSKKESA